MGILNFNNLIRKYCGESSIIQLSYLKRKNGINIAIDTSNYMYKFKGKATKKILSVTKFEYTNGEWSDINEKKILTQWLEIYLDLVIEMRKNNIRPIFVLDGNAPCEKSSTQNMRKNKIQQNTNKLLLYKKNKNELEKYKRAICNNIYIKNNDKKLLIKFLKYINCDVIQSTGEAEKLCCQLCKKNIVFGVLSSDTDLYAYGCPIIINDINLYNFYKSPTITITILNNVLNTLNLTYQQMILLCVLSGNDYNDNIPGYGVIKCYRLIKKYSVFKQVQPNDKLNNKYIDCYFSIKNNSISVNLYPFCYHKFHYINSDTHNDNLILDFDATISNIRDNIQDFKNLKFRESLDIFTNNKNYICNDIINYDTFGIDNIFDIDQYFIDYLDINYKHKIIDKIKYLSTINDNIHTISNYDTPNNVINNNDHISSQHISDNFDDT